MSKGHWRTRIWNIRWDYVCKKVSWFRSCFREIISIPKVSFGSFGLICLATTSLSLWPSNHHWKTTAFSGSRLGIRCDPHLLGWYLYIYIYYRSLLFLLSYLSQILFVVEYYILEDYTGICWFNTSIVSSRLQSFGNPMLVINLQLLSIFGTRWREFAATATGRCAQAVPGLKVVGHQHAQLMVASQRTKVPMGNLSEGYQVVGVNTLSTADQSIADQGGSQHFFVIPPNETLQDPRGFWMGGLTLCFCWSGKYIDWLVSCQRPLFSRQCTQNWPYAH